MRSRRGATQKPSRRRRATPKKPTSKAWKAVKIGLVAFGTLIAFGIGTFLVLFQNARNSAQSELQKFEDLSTSLQVSPSEIVSSDGKVLYRVSKEVQYYAPLSEIPKRVQQAIIAAEDRRFYDHDGIDWHAMGRILVTNVGEGRLAQGGSTIAMQLAKLVSSKSEKTLQRKFHDMALAYELVRDMSKDRILELYLNQVYFGSHAKGIKAAALVYFGKDLSKLTLGEAALLVRLVRNPSHWNHLTKGTNVDAAVDNRDTVLDIMLSEHMISKAEHDAAEEEIPKFNSKPPTSNAVYLAAPYFVDHVLRQFHREFPSARLDEGGYKIETTLDSELEQVAEHAVAHVVASNQRAKVSNGAFVLMNSDGQILAEVGGVDYRKEQHNAVTGAAQPGSSFKAFVYATALRNGVLKLDDSLPNERTTFQGGAGAADYSPQNDDGRYSPMTSVRNAFAESKNVPAVHVIEKTGPQNVVDTAKESFGFVSTLHPYLSLALGSSEVSMLEMLQGYSVFALHGDRATPYLIKSVTGPTGEVLRRYSPRILRDAFDPQICDQMDELMKGVVDFGTGTKARVVPNARGKTGTTTDFKDAWFCGYTDGLIGVGWVGNDRLIKGRKYHLAMNRVFGGTVTVQIWAEVMKAAHDKYGSKFAAPERQKPTTPGAEAPPLDADGDLIPEGAGPKMGPLDGDEDPGATAPVATDPGPAKNPETDKAPSTNENPAIGGDDGSSVAPPPQKPVKKPSESPGAHAEYVEVEICEETHLKASVYCPATVVHRYKKGTEPKKVCTLHTG